MARPRPHSGSQPRRQAPAVRLPKVCVDKYLPDDRAIAAGARAIALRPDNAPLPPRAPGLSPPPRLRLALARKLWPNGTVLSVAFLEGDPIVQSKVQLFAKLWEPHANVRFDFGPHARADIRIAFDTSDGSWSFIGTDSKEVGATKPTMNYGWLTPTTDDQEYERVVVHEFGHALGAIHEHQNPNANIPWDREKVYEYYSRTQGWTREDVDRNIFQKYSTTQVNASEFDPRSIMLYAVPNELTVGDFEIGWNTTLSPRDKEFIARHYPRQPVRPALIVDGPPTQASIGVPGEVDSFEVRLPARGQYELETMGKTDVILSLFGPDDPTRWVAEDDDSGVGRNARLSLELAPGQYVAQVRHYSTGVGNYGVRIRKRS